MRHVTTIRIGMPAVITARVSMPRIGSPLMGHGGDGDTAAYLLDDGTTALYDDGGEVLY